MILSPDWITGQAVLFSSLNAPRKALTGELALFSSNRFFFLQPFHWMFPRKHNLIALKCELVSSLMDAATFICTQHNTLVHFSSFRSHHSNALFPITQPLSPECFRMDWLSWHLKVKIKLVFFSFQLRNKSFLRKKFDHRILMSGGCFLLILH